MWLKENILKKKIIISKMIIQTIKVLTETLENIRKKKTIYFDLSNFFEVCLFIPPRCGVATRFPDVL